MPKRNVLELADKTDQRGQMETLVRAAKFLDAERDALKDVVVEPDGDPYDPKSWLSCAKKLLETGRLKEAEAAAVQGTLRASTDDVRTLSDLWNTIGRIMHRMERRRDEIDAYLVGIDHSCAAALSLAGALSECDQYEREQNVLEAAVNDGTEIGEILMRLGARYWNIDRKRDAEKLYRKATEMEPENLDWVLPYISLLISLGELDDAQNEIDRIRHIQGKEDWTNYYAEVVRNRREELSNDFIIVNRSCGQLPRLVRDTGCIADWVHREVEGVDAVHTNLTTAVRTGSHGPLLRHRSRCVCRWQGPATHKEPDRGKAGEKGLHVLRL